MRFLLYRIGAWIRDSRRTGYARPVLMTVAFTAILMSVYKLLERWLFPGFTLLESRVTSILVSSVLAGVMAYVALRLYRQMAQETIEELTERLRLSEELLEERNLIKSLMENTVDRIFFKDLDGRFIRVSGSVAGAFGLRTPGEVVGRSDFDFFEEEFARQGRRDEQEVIRTGLPVIGRDYREVWKDGRETWSSVSIVPLRDRHGHVIGTMGIARDITEARRREQRVRQLSRAVEQSPSMVLITDRSGCIEYVNPKFTEVTGYQAEEIRGRNPRLLNSGEHDVSLYRQLWQTITAGHEWRGELLNRKKNGDLHWVRTSVSPIRDSSGEITHFVGVTEDVTQEKKAAAAFEAEQRRRQELERIINISPAIAFRWRAAPGWPVEFVSENVRLWGYAADDLISGRVSYSSIVHPEDLDRVAREVQQNVAAGTDEFDQEYRVVWRNGEVHWQADRTWVRRDEEGRATHFQGVVVDITERHRAESAQQALVEGLRTVLQLADELIACPSEDALYLRAVELARARLGFERCGILVREGHDVRGTYGTNLKGETTAEHGHRVVVNDVWRERLRVRGPLEQRWQVVEEPYRIWEGGQVREAGTGWIGITPIQSSLQGAIGVFSNDTAITRAPVDPIKQEVLAVYCSLLGNMVARKRAEEEQRHAVDQQRQFMERTDRLNSLGLLAAGMAHEINNPLQGMLSHLHAVQRALPKEFAAQRSLEMLERGIETIATLVRKLLFLGTTEQGLEVADARESMDFVAQLLDSQLKRARVRLELRRPDRRVALAMPRRELIQILLNLMINARDAMPQGGALTVGFRVEDQMGILTIADTGNGIPPEILGRIFTPFFTTKGTKGTGLGLSVAESLVRGAGGVIQVQSRPGQGTLFTVRIPLARGDAT
jgi:PAS domain S-box-containing protein